MYFDADDRLKDSEAIPLEKVQKQTLLDKLVSNVFDKNSDMIYKDYPELTKLTVPKVPILTPRGKDIIMPN